MLGLAVPVTAALWEFFLAGRKRLGYRVQMDTSARDSATSSGPEAGGAPAHAVGRRRPARPLGRPAADGERRLDPDSRGGLRGPRQRPGGHTRGVPGPPRRRHGRDGVQPHRAARLLRTGNAGPRRHGRCHQAAQGETQPSGALQGAGGSGPRTGLHRDRLPDPEVTAGVVGGVRGGTIKRTEYYLFASRPVRWLLAALVLVSVAQSVSTFARSDETVAAPLDCAEGRCT
ncbi:hypothetical protein LV779_29240 [Streptomyces thinghirensis]|nr:hypothetical protein [Streptomyces thinghirensis]